MNTVVELNREEWLEVLEESPTSFKIKEKNSGAVLLVEWLGEGTSLRTRIHVQGGQFEHPTYKGVQLLIDMLGEWELTAVAHAFMMIAERRQFPNQRFKPEPKPAWVEAAEGAVKLAFKHTIWRRGECVIKFKSQETIFQFRSAYMHELMRRSRDAWMLNEPKEDGRPVFPYEQHGWEIPFKCIKPQLDKALRLAFGDEILFVSSGDGPLVMTDAYTAEPLKPTDESIQLNVDTSGIKALTKELSPKWKLRGFDKELDSTFELSDPAYGPFNTETEAEEGAALYLSDNVGAQVFIVAPNGIARRFVA